MGLGIASRFDDIPNDTTSSSKSRNNFDIFGEYIFVNENANEWEFENVNCDFYNYGDLCNGLLCPTLYPRPPIVDFINSRARLREQLVLKDVFDIFCDLNHGCKCGFNENFSNDGYYHATKYPTTTPAPTIKFNEADNGLTGIVTGSCGDGVLKGIYGVIWNESNIVNAGAYPKPAQHIIIKREERDYGLEYYKGVPAAPGLNIIDNYCEREEGGMIFNIGARAPTGTVYYFKILSRKKRNN